MPLASKKLRWHIGLGLTVRPSVCLYVTIKGRLIFKNRNSWAPDILWMD